MHIWFTPTKVKEVGRSYSDVTVDVFRIFMRVQQCMLITVIFALAIFRRNQVFWEDEETRSGINET